MAQATNFTLTHISGHQVSLSDYPGKQVVIAFSGRDSGDQVDKIEESIRSRYAYDEVPMIGVADLHGVPRMLHGMAKGRVESAYKKATESTAAKMRAAGKAVPDDMSQVIVLAPDWDGTVASSYGVSGTDKVAVAVVVDASGNIKGQASGPQAGEQVLALLG